MTHLPILENLNPQQREAVVYGDGPLLVIAGAGSGKTRVITHRIAYLIQERNVAPWQIFAATFTNKAAREMRERIIKLLGPAAQVRLSISTFHSLCAMLLRREAQKVGLTSRFTILDETDLKGIVRSCMERLGINSKAITPEQALDKIGQAKVKMLSPEAAYDLFAGSREDDYIAIYQAYEAMLAANDALDFDDLLLRMVRLFESDSETLSYYQDRYRHLLVDEYQDTNLSQFRFIQLLAGERMNLCAVGDEDQSIYSWRGAEISNLLDFPKVFPGTTIVRLEQNYRSTKTILEIADAVIAHNRERLGKTLWTEGEEGEAALVVAADSSYDEARFVVDQMQKLHYADGVSYADMAVFYRVNALSRSIEDELRARDISYRVIGGIRFYDRAEIKDILAYLTVIANPSCNLALARIINRPRRGIGDKTLQALQGFAQQNGLPLYEALSHPRAHAKIPKKASMALGSLCELFEKWRERSERIPLAALAEMIVDDVEYIASLGDEESLEAVTRTENVNELLGAIREYEKNSESPSLYDYLEKVALTASADETEPDQPSVSLMTMHSAKGLEFSHVYIIGLEANFFPSPRAIAAHGNEEEERRLFYVGITRAKKRVYFSWAKTRMMYGRQDWPTPSIFLHELPKAYCEGSDSAATPPRKAHGTTTGNSSFYGQMRQSARSGFGRKKKPRVVFDTGEQRYAVGQIVEHLFMGAGEVVGIEGEGSEKRILVKFEDGDVTEVLERYGDLRIIG